MWRSKPNKQKAHRYCNTEELFGYSQGQQTRAIIHPSTTDSTTRSIKTAKTMLTDINTTPKQISRQDGPSHLSTTSLLHRHLRPERLLLLMLLHFVHSAERHRRRYPAVRSRAKRRGRQQNLLLLLLLLLMRCSVRIRRSVVPPTRVVAPSARWWRRLRRARAAVVAAPAVHPGRGAVVAHGAPERLPRSHHSRISGPYYVLNDVYSLPVADLPRT